MKKGFTLAEVLVALAIIGVVAAITMPTFMANTANAKIGPALANAVSNFEQANAQLIAESGAKSLLGVKGTWDVYKDGKYVSTEGSIVGEGSGLINKSDLYVAALSEYLKGSYNDKLLTAKSGASYTVLLFPKSLRDFQNKKISSTAPHKTFIGGLTLDINGEAKPNKDGQDIFYFGLFADGSLRPRGGSAPYNNTEKVTWRENCPPGEEPSDAKYCAGHIFENNLKVLYE